MTIIICLYKYIFIECLNFLNVRNCLSHLFRSNCSFIHFRGPSDPVRVSLKHAYEQNNRFV